MRRSPWLVPLIAGLLALAACGDADDNDRAGTAAGPSAPSGELAVRLEPIAGILIEGFEVGLRFELADGTVIASTLWSDFVTAQPGEPTIEDYYTSVLHQQVPPGEVVVLATANLGEGPPPVRPDLDGDLRCRLVVDVPSGGRTDVEVRLLVHEGENCLRQR